MFIQATIYGFVLVLRGVIVLASFRVRAYGFLQKILVTHVKLWSTYCVTLVIEDLISIWMAVMKNTGFFFFYKRTKSFVVTDRSEFSDNRGKNKVRVDYELANFNTEIINNAVFFCTRLRIKYISYGCREV